MPRPDLAETAEPVTTAECWLEPAPREPEDPRAFLSTKCSPHVQRLPEELRERLMDEVLAGARRGVCLPTWRSTFLVHRVSR